MSHLQGKTALVTGVGRKKGIGAAICRALAHEGVNIFYTYFHPYDVALFPESEAEDPAAFVQELQALGVHAACCELDLSEPDAAVSIFDAVQKAVGVPDILINNATVSTRQSFTDVTAELLDQHYTVNVRATTLLCKEFMLRKRDGEGTILCMTSGQDLGVMPDELPYTITKASIEMLVRQLAPELQKYTISINALDPGATDTGWITEELREQVLKESPMGIAEPEAIGSAVVSLLADSSRQTGQIIHVGLSK